MWGNRKIVIAYKMIQRCPNEQKQKSQATKKAFFVAKAATFFHNNMCDLTRVFHQSQIDKYQRVDFQ